MAMQSPFFGKREVDPVANRHHVPPSSLQARGGVAVHAVPTVPAPPPSASPEPVASDGGGPARESGSKLTVGPNIKLKGVEITDCDTLLVEGNVEATMDSRLMQIAAGGSFKGSADIDLAEIHGLFDGTLTVRQRLVVHGTGKVTGKVRYGRLVVEEGGQLSGDIQHGTEGPPPVPAKPLLQAA